MWYSVAIWPLKIVMPSLESGHTLTFDNHLKGVRCFADDFAHLLLLNLTTTSSCLPSLALTLKYYCYLPLLFHRKLCRLKILFLNRLKYSMYLVNKTSLQTDVKALMIEPVSTTEFEKKIIHLSMHDSEVKTDKKEFFGLCNMHCMDVVLNLKRFCTYW